jgi:hypothetical protein
MMLPPLQRRMSALRWASTDVAIESAGVTLLGAI